MLKSISGRKVSKTRRSGSMTSLTIRRMLRRRPTSLANTGTQGESGSRKEVGQGRKEDQDQMDIDLQGVGHKVEERRKRRGDEESSQNRDRGPFLHLRVQNLDQSHRDTDREALGARVQGREEVRACPQTRNQGLKTS